MKKILLISLLIISVLIMYSCGSDNKTENNNKENTEEVDNTENTDDASVTDNEIEEEEDNETTMDCNEFLAEYEVFMLKYTEACKSYLETPTDQTLLINYTTLADEAYVWDNSTPDCKDDPAFMAKLSEIQMKVFEADGYLY